MKLIKENIEFLGWKYVEDFKRYELDDSNPLNYRYFYMYHRLGCLVYKSIITIYLNGTNNYDKVVERIQINDILELRWLMNRLNINENNNTH